MLNEETKPVTASVEMDTMPLVSVVASPWETSRGRDMWVSGADASDADL